ncbi:MAG: hypothetical protein HQ512_06525 [Rhodospirillales bacterium]|nr:hypothetical protein [Rhodospirillales bacterium]
MITTEKTLTDHGLSALTSKDCVVWRGLNGEEVCRDEAFDPSAVAGIAEIAEIEGQQPTPAEQKKQQSEKTHTPVETKLPEVVEIEEDDVIDTTDDGLGASKDPEIAFSLETDTIPAETAFPIPGIVETKPEGGTYFIIASYRHLDNARRFTDGKKNLHTKVLSGTASGRPVFRIAVGPVTKTGRRHARESLIKGGFGDVWTLRLENPNVILELAAMN